MKIFSLLCAAVFWAVSALAAGLPDPAAFFIAVERGDVAQARKWLDAGLPVDFEGHQIGSGLMIAAWEGNVPMMALFHQRGADLNKANALGEQPLLHAAWRGHLPAVRWLVERGARLNRTGKAWSALHYAAFAGHDEVAAFLLERGADVNALSVNGSTPLMMSAREGKEDLAQRLLSAGARTDITNDAGENAMDWAMRNNNLRIARTIGGSENFARAAAAPPESRGLPVRSQPVPDRVDMLLAQARKLEAAGRRDAALKVYRAAMTSLRKMEAQTAKANPKPNAAPRKVTGMMITARRAAPSEQTAGLNYATPGAGLAGDKIGATEGAAAGTASAAVTADPVDDWLRRGRELEAAGRRAEALQAYRQASALLRAAR